MRWGAVLMLATSLGACSTPPDSRVLGHYFGYVRIVAPADVGDGGARTEVASLGAWIETAPATSQFSGAGLGFRKAGRVTIPADCRLAVIVQNEAQLAAARDLIRSFEGKDACAIDATEH